MVVKDKFIAGENIKSIIHPFIGIGLAICNDVMMNNGVSMRKCYVM